MQYAIDFEEFGLCRWLKELLKECKRWREYPSKKSIKKLDELMIMMAKRYKLSLLVELLSRDYPDPIIQKKILDLVIVGSPSFCFKKLAQSISTKRSVEMNFVVVAKKPK